MQEDHGREVLCDSQVVSSSGRIQPRILGSRGRNLYIMIGWAFRVSYTSVNPVLYSPVLRGTVATPDDGDGGTDTNDTSHHIFTGALMSIAKLMKVCHTYIIVISFAMGDNT